MKSSLYCIGKRRQKLKDKREYLESAQMNAVRELLPNEAIKAACAGSDYSFRRRLLTPVVTIFHMLQAAIHREGSFQSAWQSVGEVGGSDALAKARRRLPVNVWQRLHKWIQKQIEGQSAGKGRWRGHRVLGVDGTCVSMSDEPQLAKHFGRGGSKKQSRFPLARIVFAFNLRTLVCVEHVMGSYRTDETALFVQMMPGLARMDVIVGDRHLAGANLYYAYVAAGLAYITLAHQKLKIESLAVVYKYSCDDMIVRMPIGATYRKRSRHLPEYIEVRVIKMIVGYCKKREIMWLATSLLDAQRYPKAEIKQLYRRRWKVEGLIEEMKVWLHSDILRSKTVAGIEKELYARMIASNLVHWLMLRAAKRKHAPIDRLSMAGALRLTETYGLKMSVAPAGQLPLLYEELLERISLCITPYRPGRIEPRLIKRDTIHYEWLKIPRAQWRAEHVCA